MLTESQILWYNAKHLGLDLSKYFLDYGHKVAQEIITKFGTSKKYALVCGLGGNGTDGLAVAFELAKNNCTVTIYLPGRTKNFENPLSQELWDELKTRPNVSLKQEIYAEDIVQPDILIESLVGEGFTGSKLNKRYYDIVKRFSHFNSKLVAIDVPCPHYAPDRVYSINYPKTKDAEVVQIDYPQELEQFCGPGEFAALWKPNKGSHKGKNGKILFIGEDDMQWDLIKHYSTNVARFSFKPSGIRHETSVRELNASELNQMIETVDVVILGNFEEDIVSVATLNFILAKYHDKKFVASGNSITLLNKTMMNSLSDLTIVVEKSQVRLLSSEKKSIIQPINLRRFAVENKVNLVVLGFEAFLFNKEGEMKIERELEDVRKVALKIGAYAAKNDTWLAARASFR